MANNQNSIYISEGNKWLQVLKDKKYLELADGEKAAVKDVYNRIRGEVKNYQSPNASLLELFNALTEVLDGQEGFFWVSVAE